MISTIYKDNKRVINGVYPNGELYELYIVCDPKILKRKDYYNKMAQFCVDALYKGAYETDEEDEELLFYNQHYILMCADDDKIEFVIKYMLDKDLLWSDEDQEFLRY
jgi:hypothetical protein